MSLSARLVMTFELWCMARKFRTHKDAQGLTRADRRLIAWVKHLRELQIRGQVLWPQ